MKLPVSVMVTGTVARPLTATLVLFIVMLVIVRSGSGEADAVVGASTAPASGNTAIAVSNFFIVRLL
ncbi:hypothetical protein GCM10009745_66390 [Kribbella yunnanensis]|uniref:Secreted peptide n=1 Tax=Kribbella yunnanensis TaxID=190194 RepID=A0ABP4UU89_9ACTN